ncbi:caspase b-like isoform X1 [Tigriopus californicus]|uniref:caspase b-like isoform X1 n=2 Tax=Tigriopus californicus TaxID=6832 RepID=UPI0027DA81D7|nr:caspase b-like isoform X1 [Tigriopus californicus]
MDWSDELLKIDFSSMQIPTNSYLRVNVRCDVGSYPRIPNIDEVSLDLDECIKLAKGLNSSDVISLAFLLINEDEAAFKLCQLIEQKQNFAWGEWFFKKLKEEGAKKNNHLWMVSIICACHLIRHYKLLLDLTGLRRSEIISKYEDKEYYFLNHVRVMLFKFSLNMTTSEAMDFVEKLNQDLQKDSSIASLAPKEHFRRLETNLLELMQDRNRFNPKRDFSRFRKYLNDDTMFTYDEYIRPLVPFKPETNDTRLLKKGFLLILNQKDFSKASNFDNRDGTERDEVELLRTMGRYGCAANDRLVLTNLKAKEILPRIKKAIDGDFEGYDYIMVTILSHGERVDDKDYILGVDGQKESLNRIRKEVVQAPKLKKLKLKLFLVQACRGKEPQRMICNDSSSTLRTLDLNSVSPACKDWIIFHSTVPEYISYRNSREGTYFIQLLCKELDVHGGSMELLTLLNRVARNVMQTTGIQVPLLEIASFSPSYFQETIQDAHA